MIEPGRALVTGAGRRLGAAIARHLGAAGWDVAVHYSGSAEGAEEVAAELRDLGRRAVSLQADLLDEAATNALVPRAAEALGGPLTCLVNNASIFEDDRIGSISTDSWHRAMATNLHAPVLLTQAFAAQAPEAGRDERGEPLARALVVNMADQRVRKLTPNFVSYTLAKSALWTFTQTAARALAPAIRINAIGPGPTLQGANQSDEGFARQRAATVLERGSNPADIVAAVDYFLSADGVTGQLLCADGGQHLAWQTPDVTGDE